MEQAGQRNQPTVTATPKGTAVSLHTQAHEITHTTAPPASKPKCAGCHRPGHHIRECNKFRSQGINTRNDIARRAKLCWRCLKNKHPCACTSQCSHSSGGHHRASMAASSMLHSFLWVQRIISSGGIPPTLEIFSLTAPGIDQLGLQT